MGYGRTHLVPCPSCGAHLDFVDYEADPPPIPPPAGGYQKYNSFLQEGAPLSECPLCGCNLEGVTVPGDVAA